MTGLDYDVTGLDYDVTGCYYDRTGLDYDVTGCYYDRTGLVTDEYGAGEQGTRDKEQGTRRRVKPRRRFWERWGRRHSATIINTITLKYVYEN